MSRPVSITQLDLPVGDEFSLAATIRSHGWSNLGPFCSDAEGRRLTVHLDLRGLMRAEVTQNRSALAVAVESPKPIPRARANELLAALRSCLRVDLDLAPFWDLCARDPALSWVAEHRAGRILRAPTAFADAAMILATTNCSWVFSRA